MADFGDRNVTERAWRSREKRSPSKITDAIVSVAFLGMASDDAAMASFENRAQFERWLEDKPVSWAQILACRAALRVLPFAVFGRAGGSEADFGLLAFRALGISWAARNMPDKDMRIAAAAAQVAAADAADAAYADADLDASYASYAIDAAAEAASAAAGHGAAYAAAYSAAHAGYAAADAAIWSSIDDDIKLLDTHSEPDRAAEALTAQGLWRGKEPKWFVTRWAIARRRLQKRGAGFDLWIDWFERRIAGHATAFAVSPAQDREVQIKIAEQDNAFWGRDPAVVNAEIQSWIDAAASAEPSIPAQHPNELITTVRDGRIVLDHRSPLPTTPEQDQRRRAAWQAIRDALDDYLADGPTDNHPRLNRMIDRLSAALGADFDALNPVGLGMQAQYLQQYAAHADDFLIADRAADLVGLNVVVGSLLPQFAEWRAYVDDAGARSDVPREALTAAAAVVAAIAQHDVAEPKVNAVLTEMVADANDEAAIADPGDAALSDPDAAASEPKLQTYRQRLMGGLSNSLASMSKIALDAAKWLGEKGWKLTKSTAGYVIKAGDPGLQEAIKAGTKYGALYVMFTAVDQLTALAGLQPGLAWLGPLLVFLKANVLKD